MSDSNMQTAEIERIYYANYLTVYRLALARSGGNAQNAGDIFGEVFLVLAKYVRRGGTFNGAEHEKAWLIRTTINCSRLIARTYAPKPLPDTEELCVTDHTEESDVFERVMALPEKYRVVIHLHYYEGYSVKEISRLLNRGENTVKSQLMRGRERLKTELGGTFYESGEL